MLFGLFGSGWTIKVNGDVVDEFAFFVSCVYIITPLREGIENTQWHDGMSKISILLQG